MLVIPDELFMVAIAAASWRVVKGGKRWKRNAALFVAAAFALGVASKNGALPVTVGAPFYTHQWFQRVTSSR
jgi:hypothetical protein